jgi:hypothetical protein
MNSEHDRLMAMTEDEVFAEIGSALLDEQFGAVRPSRDEAARAGRSWFISVLPSIRKRICGDPVIKAHLMGDTAAARNTAVLAILDTYLAGMFSGFPMATISHAIVLYGVHKICGGEDVQNPD